MMSLYSSPDTVFVKQQEQLQQDQHLQVAQHLQHLPAGSAPSACWEVAENKQKILNLQLQPLLVYPCPQLNHALHLSLALSLAI